MLEGFKALLGSEKAIAGGALIIGATVLVIVGAMTVVAWQEYTRDIFIIYVSGKTVQGAVSAITDSKTNKAKIDAVADVATTQIVAKQIGDGADATR